MLQSLLAPKKTFHRATSNLLSYIGNKFNRLNAIVFNRNKIRYNKGNALLIGKSELKHCSILIIGKNNCVRIEDGCNLRGVRILVSGNGSKVTIGCNVIINASKYQPTIINAAGGTSVSIGDNSLLSNNIEIHSSDYHDVLNDEGHVINEPQNTFIGNHVWIGLGSTLLKGTRVGDGCVIGAQSLLNKKFETDNCIIAGNPAKILKKNISWN